VRATAPNPDLLSAFAALRDSDDALTVMVVNKALSGSTSLTLNLSGFTPGALAQRWQLAANTITHLADVSVSGASLQATLPGPSVTLFVIPGVSVQPPSVSVSDASIPEGDAGATNAALQVTLSAPSASPVSVSYATANGSATAGSDYTASSGSVSFAPGSTSSAILVPVLGDVAPEPLETFSVTLSGPVSATLGDASAIATIVDDDGGAPLLLELSHGFRTTRDFDASAAHVYRLRQAPRASYEVVVDGLSGDVGGSGPLLRRLASDLSTVLSDSTPAGAGRSRTLAWENPAGSAALAEYVVVQSAGCSSCGPSDAYRIRAYETTVSAARFNNTGNQVTVLLLESLSRRTITGNVHFWNAQGALLANAPFTLAPRALFALNTSSVAGAGGQSGSITVSHDGRYGDLTGKAVAVEASTGFTFDTPLSSRPR
jgi:hypothetical protein